VRFLQEDLLPQVQAGFGEYERVDKERLEEQLAETMRQAQDLLGVTREQAEQSPKAVQFKEQIQAQADITQLEQEVYDHLYRFFRRYYHEGDFLSLRRYTDGAYAIPYNGEEVKLHWANADQYYIKTAEHFQNYAFKLPSERRVRFEVVSASTEQNNNKPVNGRERRFILYEADPAVVEGGGLVLRFEYRADEQKRKQAALSQAAYDAVMALPDLQDWQKEFAIKAPTEKNPDRTLLQKYLADFTARNTFDYFIHKNLGKFLRRELDFYIKSEVINLADIQHESPIRVKHLVSKVRVLNDIGDKIIQFLEQIEEFQKKLWLKKKFVLETHYCVALSEISESFYPEIVACDAQWNEWKALVSIDEEQTDLFTHGKAKKERRLFLLNEYPTLLVDTRLFSNRFKEHLLQSFDDIDSIIDGLLINSENFQAIRLISERYGDSIKCIYADPPYNTDATPILYKNGYRKSSWTSMIADRLSESKALLRRDGIACITIDDYQYRELDFLLGQIYGEDNLAGTVVIRSNPSGRPTPVGFAQSHEYAVFAKASSEATIGQLPRTARQESRYSERDQDGNFMWELFRKRGSNSERKDRPTLFYPIYANDDNLRVPEMEWDETLREWLIREDPLPQEEVLWPIDDSGTERTWRGKWEKVASNPENFKVKNSKGKTTLYYKFRPSSKGVIPTSMWIDSKYSATEHGTGTLKELFSEYNVFDFPKSIYSVIDCLTVSGFLLENDICIDLFAGSGTTGHAVIQMNRDTQLLRRFILLEVEQYFEKVLLPRIKKVSFSPSWKDGRPTRGANFEESKISPRIIKYLRLESYEDALNNIKDPQRTQQQELALERDPRFREEYMLTYKLDTEARGSASLLNPAAFIHPFNYQLKTTQNDDTRYVTVDLIETFNYLLGLTVQRLNLVEAIKTVRGVNRWGDRILVIWRDLDEVDNDALDDWFKAQSYDQEDPGFDLVYVNGDHNLENLRPDTETWRVLLTDAEFHRLMFDISEV
jgi:adenine-specific DNA-methyltransferase